MRAGPAGTVPPRGPGRPVHAGPCPTTPATQETRMFFFFSNRLGCLGSILLSLVVTGVLLLLLNR
ncbi:hypothetical protein GCM10027596_38690 [Nocardioides korecus]